VGDRVVSNGRHAEMITAPMNLCAKVPAAVSNDQAAFTTIAAIALQGIRLVQPTLGENVVVTGLGLIGQITIQLLQALVAVLWELMLTPKGSRSRATSAHSQ